METVRNLVMDLVKRIEKKLEDEGVCSFRGRYNTLCVDFYKGKIKELIIKIDDSEIWYDSVTGIGVNLKKIDIEELKERLKKLLQSL